MVHADEGSLLDDWAQKNPEDKGGKEARGRLPGLPRPHSAHPQGLEPKQVNHLHQQPHNV